MNATSWPPSLKARVRSADGEEFSVASQRQNDRMGEYVVVRRRVQGGWKALPLTWSDWVHRGFVEVSPSESAAASPLSD